MTDYGYTCGTCGTSERGVDRLAAMGIKPNTCLNCRGHFGTYMPRPANKAARTTDPDTSHIAAASQTEAKRQRDQQKVLNALRAHPAGLNDFELEAVTGVQQTSIGKRRGELCDSDRYDPPLVEYAGVKRPSPSGSPSMVWRLSDAGWRHVNRAGAA